MFPTSANSENGPTPDCELNPLSNRLLAANLGRWAEVYFTNPPERRAQAVAGLLQELEMETAGNPKVSDSELPKEESTSLNANSELTSSQAAESIPADKGIVCAACGHVNLEGQSFCGMCGVRLAFTPEEKEEEEEEEEEKLQEPTQRARMAQEQNIHGIFGPYYNGDTSELQGRLDSAGNEYGSLQSSVTLDTEDTGLPSFARQPESVPYRYRLYVGVVLAIVLGGLIYLGKRGDVFSDGQQSPDAKIIPAAQPSAPTQAAPNTASNSPLPTEKVAENENPPQPKPEAEPQPRASASQKQTPRTTAPRSTLASAITPAAPSQRATSESQNGAENLAEAQRYLNGTAGIRNTREAVPLLWDAVSKGNAPATLVLSDLYLRGDGIAQNCDQARLLLDIAAKKGIKGAAERLRHLQAFGCR